MDVQWQYMDGTVLWYADRRKYADTEKREINSKTSKFDFLFMSLKIYILNYRGYLFAATSNASAQL